MSSMCWKYMPEADAMCRRKRGHENGCSTEPLPEDGVFFEHDDGRICYLNLEQQLTLESGFGSECPVCHGDREHSIG